MNSDTVKKTSIEIGEMIRKLHDKEYALFDPRFDNFIVVRDREKNEIYHTDLELLTKASEYQKRWDIVTYDASALHLESQKCKAAIEGFHIGYGEKLRYSDILLISIYNYLFPFTFIENGRQTINRMLNFYTLTKKVS